MINKTYIMKRSVLFVLSLFLIQLCVAQSTEVQHLLDKWELNKENTLSYIDSMPADQMTFKPTPEVQSFREQCHHVARNMIWISTSFLGGKGFEKREPQSKEEIRQYLSEVFDYVIETIPNVDSLNMDEDIEFFTGPLPRRRTLFLLDNHLTHHKGQWIFYLRLNGANPPRFRGW